MHLHSQKQGMHCNITQATTVKDWVRALRHKTPLTHIDFFLIVCVGHQSNPLSLNHAGSVITTSGVFPFFFFLSLSDCFKRVTFPESYGASEPVERDEHLICFAEYVVSISTFLDTQEFF